jgi:hypothetical protein
MLGLPARSVSPWTLERLPFSSESPPVPVYACTGCGHVWQQFKPPRQWCGDDAGAHWLTGFDDVSSLPNLYAVYFMAPASQTRHRRAGGLEPQSVDLAREYLDWAEGH